MTNLLQKSVIYRQKMFNNIGPRSSVTKQKKRFYRFDRIMTTNCILMLLLDVPDFQTFLRINPTWIGSTDATDATDSDDGSKG